jgi:tRNA A-37 threonylcarbamoyl transferase component Bud32
MMINCGQCAKEVAEGARFCVHCGAQVSDPHARTILVEEDESDLLLRNLSRELAGDYQVERELGRGGMAIVYEAVDVHLGRRVALKVLPPEMAMRRSMAERFKREAKMAAALDHPNIVPVYRVGQSGGLLYIAMKFIKGRPLDSILQTQGPLQIPVVLTILRAAASALAYAHERGIVHRDVKSANIMIDTDGRAVVSDFGIARAVEDPTITATGTVVGTPYFMSPEQCAARRIGPQSDQYSLGVVAFQMLMGAVPFNADTLPGIMHHHFYTPVPNLRLVRPEIPEALNTVVMRMLAKKSEDRFASTAALASAILDIPLGDSGRREAETILRDLAGGASAPRVAVDQLPPLLSSVRLTPATSRVFERLQFRLTRPLLAITGGLVITFLGLGGVWMLGRASAPTDEGDGARSAIAIEMGRYRRNRARDSVRIADSLARIVARAESLAVARGRVSTRTASDLAAVAPASFSGSPSGTARSETAASGAGGKIRLRVYPPAAQIYIDDRLLGTGVVMDSVLTPGTRRLRVEAQGFDPHEATFEITSGQTTSLGSITLKPRDGGM